MLPLPEFEAPEQRAQPGRSDAERFLHRLLQKEVALIARGDLQVVSIARRPGVLSKVAVRATVQTRFPIPDASETDLPARVPGDDLARLRDLLGGERIEVMPWQRNARAYITTALGLAEPPAMVLLPAIGHAHVLLGEIDLLGIAGWRGLNVVLASTLTGWRIRLKPIAQTAAWHRLTAAMRARTVVNAAVLGPSERGVRMEVLGLYGTLAPGEVPETDEVQVRVRRMDPDEGRVFLTTGLPETGQLRLP